MDPIIPPLDDASVGEASPNGNGAPKPHEPAYAVFEETFPKAASVAVSEGDQPLLRHVGLAERDSDLRWYSPAVPSPIERAGQVEGLLEGVSGTLEGHKGWQQYLSWTYHTRVRAAAEELSTTERQVRQSTEERARRMRVLQGRLDEEIERLEKSRPDLEKGFNDEADAYADALRRAGLSGQPDDAAIGPRHVEEALHDAAPTLDEIAGERGIVPRERARRGLGRAS